MHITDKLTNKSYTNTGDNMTFTELNETEYNIFWENHSQKTFLSSTKIGKLRNLSGWNFDYIGIKNGDKIIAAAMLLSIKRHFNKYEFYSPRGFLMDYNNIPLYDFFIKNIKEYIKNKNGYILRIDPYIINVERDINGKVVKNGINNKRIKDNLLKTGFKKAKVNEQVSWMFSLNINNKGIEQIFKEMKPNTKNIIRKTEKMGISIEELKYDELSIFYKILLETSRRKKFRTRDLKYYQNMYNLFHKNKEIKYLICKINLEKYIDKLTNEINLKEKKLASLKQTRYNDKKKESLNKEIVCLKSKINDSKMIIKKEHTHTIVLSGSMFILIKPEIIYLSSGNYIEYMNFNSQYLLQWEMIKYAINNNFKKYNFYGIPANINKHPKNYGIYEFKKGFNGCVEELIGEYELPITKHYYIIRLIQKIKKIL